MRAVKLNKAIQGIVFGMLKDDSEIAAKKSLDIMVHLYRKRVWVVSFVFVVAVSTKVFTNFQSWPGLGVFCIVRNTVTSTPSAGTPTPSAGGA